MTCKVAVMNKLGIALAADSAVTVGNGEKIYHHVDKIFPLSFKPPIAALIYGSADMMGVPWEIIVQMYADKFGEKRCRTIEECAGNFFKLVSQLSLLFPASRQREYFYDSVGKYWDGCFLESLQKQREANPKLSKRQQQELLSKIIHKENDDWSESKPIERSPSNFGSRVTVRYARELSLLARRMFGSELLSPQIKSGLRRSVQYLYSHYWSPSDEEAFPYYTGVVFAGIGENDLFPVLQDYHVADITAGRLRYRMAREARVTHDDSAHVVPFAQTDMIELFYTGIHPKLRGQLTRMVTESLSSEMGKNDDRRKVAKYERFVKKFHKLLDEEICKKHTDPLIEAVDALPRHDLARMALALVSLTELRRKMAINETETVAGPINVAVLSKRDGFVWIEREIRATEAGGTELSSSNE